MRRCLTILALLALTALAPASARADGVPPSDVLLGQDVFLPYAPNTVSKPLQAALKTTMERAKAKGYEVKIALIADQRDLGSVAQLLNKPQDYANLLTQEISLNVTHGSKVQRPRVLTVQPSGIGGNNLGDNAGDALDGVRPVPDAGGDDLARTAAIAVGKLAAADGKPIVLPELPQAAAAPAGGGSGGGLPGWVFYAAPVLLVGVAIFAVNARGGEGADAGLASGEDRAGR